MATSDVNASSCSSKALPSLSLSAAEQGFPGRGVPQCHLLYRHAVVQRVGELCQGQGQWYEPSTVQGAATLHSSRA